jgi:raffinose/stachyose/melibiose transport system substrate-binding protein
MSPQKQSTLHRSSYVLAITSALAALLLTQCASPTAAPAATQVPATTQAPAATPTPENITLEFWDYTNPGTYEPWWQKFVAAYQSSHPGVHINRTPIDPKDYDAKLNTAFAANSEPDILFVISGAGLNDYAKAGKVVALDKLLDTSIWTPGIMSSLSYNGSAYAVPLGPQPSPFWYNTKLLADHNLQPPQTWAQLLSLCDTLSAANITPLALGGLERWEASMYYQDIVNQVGGPDLMDKAATGKGASFTDAPFVASGKHLLELFDHKCFPADFSGTDFNAMSQTFFNGDAAMELMGPWLVGMAHGLAPAGFTLGAARFPKLPEAIAGTENNLEGGINSLAISARSKHPEAAAQFLAAFGKANQDFITAVDYLPSIPGATVKDPALNQVAGFMTDAKVMYAWADRRLPAVLVEDYLNNLTAMVTKEITPEDFGAKMAAAVAQKVK